MLLFMRGINITSESFEERALRGEHIGMIGLGLDFLPRKIK